MDKTNNIETGLEGLRVGLKTFILTYILAFMIALVVNLSFIEDIKNFLQGTMGDGVGFNFGLVIKATSIIMNLSVFNTSGTIQLGLLIFVILPFFAFFIADRNDNKKEGMDLKGFIIYIVASLIYTVLLMLLSLISRGDFLGVEIDFLSLRNVLMTFVITLLIQVVIGMNYDVHRLPGIIATRWMVRLLVGFAFVVGIIGFVVFALKYTTNPVLILFAVIVLVPNIAIYLMFMMMGISVEFNTELEKLMSFAQIDLSYGSVPILLRVVLMALFILFVFISIYKMDHSRYLRGMIVFALSFPAICLLAALCTVIDLGDVKFIGSIRFGIDYLQAFMYPFLAVGFMGVVDLAIKHFFTVLKD